MTAMNQSHASLPPLSGHWLAIAEEDFIPADSGGRLESLNMLRAAQDAGIRLHVIIPGMKAAAAYRAALPGAELEGIPRRTGWRAHASVQPYLFVSRPLPPDLIGRIKREHHQDPFDAVIGVSFRVAHLSTALADSIGVPLLVRPHNVESEYFDELARSVTFPRNLPYLVEASKMRRAERAIHESGRVALFADIGEGDAERRSALTTAQVIHVPPFVGRGAADQERGPTCSRDGRTVLFLGALDNPNNVGGVRWFVKECWPDLRNNIQGIDFHVVGRRASASLVAELTAAGVRVTVDAPSVMLHLTGADVFINPVLQGAGVNIKMVEALSAGLAVVSSGTGARGMPWRDGEHLLIADGPRRFGRAVDRLLHNPEERGSLGAAGRQFVERELDGLHQINRMRDALSSLSYRS